LLALTRAAEVVEKMIHDSIAIRKDSITIDVVLSGIDSLTSVELIFDQGLGDVFSVRIAGDIIN